MSFPLPGQYVDGAAIAPEIALWIFACAALLVEFWRPRRPQGSAVDQLLSAEAFAFVGLLVALALSVFQYWSFPAPHAAFSGSLAMDPLAWFYRSLCILTSLILVPSSAIYLRQRPNRPEFFALLLLATSGMTLMVASNDLIMLFLSIEFLSITSYVLVGYLKNSRRSTEASVKYFLFGSICSALMLYGMSLLYALTGTVSLAGIGAHLPGTAASEPILALVIVTFFAGIGFKISMWPFHMWAPDAYEGAPTPVTAFLAVGPKLAGIAIFLRVVQTMLVSDPHWPLLLGLSAMITMTWGNLAALGQNNVKRLLAYSSIAQAGYLLVGVVAISAAQTSSPSRAVGMGILEYAMPAVLVYSLAYLVMNLGVFIVAIEVERRTGSADITAFAGLGTSSPGLSVAMTIFLLGLAGIPLTAGFIGKLYLFGAAVLGGAYTGNALLWSLAGFGVANSVVSVFYYFKIVQPIWMSPPAEATDHTRSPAVEGLTFFLAFLTIALGIYGRALTSPALRFDSVYGSPLRAEMRSIAPDVVEP